MKKIPSASWRLFFVRLSMVRMLRSKQCVVSWRVWMNPRTLIVCFTVFGESEGDITFGTTDAADTPEGSGDGTSGSASFKRLGFAAVFAAIFLLVKV